MSSDAAATADNVSHHAATSGVTTPAPHNATFADEATYQAVWAALAAAAAVMVPLIVLSNILVLSGPIFCRRLRTPGRLTYCLFFTFKTVCGDKVSTLLFL